MKIKHIQALAILLLTMITNIVNAQQTGISISGKVKSSDGQEALYGASISVDRKAVGTATNSNGQFALTIPANNLNDTLRISHIGFKTRFIGINTLKNGQGLNITLEKNSTELKEVTVHYYDPAKILAKAIARIGVNYIDHPHILRGFYRMYTTKGAKEQQESLELSEAVFDVFNFGYTDKRADLFKLIRARDEKNDRDFSSLELSQKPNTIFNYDVVNHIATSGFLNESGIKNHKFEIRGIVDFKGFEAYEFQFKELPGVEDRTYRGKFYVDTKTYAFIYFDFGLSPSGLTNTDLGNFTDRILTRVAGVETEMKRDRTKVGYQRLGDKWVLSDVVGDNALAIKSKDLNYDFTANIKFNYQVTSVDTTKVESFSSKIGRNENINSHEKSGGEEFWKDYNILLADYNAEDIFQHIQDVNKQVATEEKLKKLKQ